MKRFILLVFLTLVPATALFTAQLPEYSVKSEFLERFTRFIDWPDDSAVADHGVPFVIGLFGGDPFKGYLTQMAHERKIKNKPVEIRFLAAPDDVLGCDMVFVSAAGEESLPRIISLTQNKTILTVGDTPGFCEKGILINFYKAGANIRFEINEAAVRGSGLKMSGRLLNLARIVKTAEK